MHQKSLYISTLAKVLELTIKCLSQESGLVQIKVPLVSGLVVGHKAVQKQSWC